MINDHILINDKSDWTDLAPGLRRKLIHTNHLMMVVVEFTNGPAEVPFHDHPHEQVSYIAEGELILFIKGVGEQKLQKGDLFAIPSGIPHTVQTLTPVVRIIDSFTPIREEFV
ncbi:MAG: cupin domain-containing protein [Bacteroidales bacterium]|nr:cupin domain-containing protein [Bacteroidales bacterium]